MIDLIGDLALRVQWLLEYPLLGLLVVCLPVLAGVKTKSWVAALVSLLAGVVVWTLVLSREDLRDAVDEDFQNPGPVVVEPEQEGS